MPTSAAVLSRVMSWLLNSNFIRLEKRCLIPVRVTQNRGASSVRQLYANYTPIIRLLWIPKAVCQLNVKRKSLQSCEMFANYRATIKAGFIGPQQRLKELSEIDSILKSNQEIDKVNPLELKLKLHLCCLSILRKVLIYDTGKFISLEVFKDHHMEALLQLVEYEETHRECCVGATTKEHKEMLPRLGTSLEDRLVKVVAIDYGWDKRVPRSTLYVEDLFRVVLGTDEEILGINYHQTLSRLCKLDDVNPSTNPTLPDAVTILVLLCHGTIWTSYVFPKYTTQLLRALAKSRDKEVTVGLVYLFATGTGKFVRDFIEPLSGILTQFIDCVDVMRAALLVYRMAITNSNLPQSCHTTIMVEKILPIYQRHQGDEVIDEHFTVIAHRVVGGVEIKVPAEESRGGSAAAAVVHTATPLPQKPSTGNEEEEHPFTMHDYVFDETMSMVKEGRRVAFLQNWDNSKNRDDLAREIVSMVNERGGTIYIGVVEDLGPIHPGCLMVSGLVLDRKQRDQLRLLVDDLCTDNQFISSKSNDKISSGLVDLKFEQVNNIYDKRIAPDKALVVAVITVNVEGWSGDLFKYNETIKKDEEPEWVYWVRNDLGKSREYNDVRQAMARRGLEVLEGLKKA
eukprot:sb/3479367/